MVIKGDKCVVLQAESSVGWPATQSPRAQARDGDKTHLLLTSHGKQKEWEGPVQKNTFAKGKLTTYV